MCDIRPMTAYPEDHLRVTAGQRDQAASVLREATADQRLTFEEFEARLPRALTAVTRRDLYDLLEDLVPSEELSNVIVDAVNLGTAPGMSWDNPYVITAHAWDVRAGRMGDASIHGGQHRIHVGHHALLHGSGRTCLDD